MQWEDVRFELAVKIEFDVIIYLAYGLNLNYLIFNILIFQSETRFDIGFPGYCAPLTKQPVIVHIVS